ncbi:MAG: hypothetical protein P0Y64_02135 [Candidatus Sphingomonas colombiensis]|nr:hypothetical protein [Sphingomonas sp.]WEK43655.1 MAG: hypothetical protein P0Y64_02135 [Sphingomonas sp.]
MNDRHALIAYLATLGALVFIFSVALVAGSLSSVVMGKLEVFGLGTITGGLIGILRMPAWRSTADRPEQSE